MSTYAVGDVQGCARSLDALLTRLPLDGRRDRLWFVGDLVNRGPGSLEVLRKVRALGDGATVVLGNHDLHLLARAVGVRPAEPDDTLDEVLSAPDRDELVGWLLQRPLLHVTNGLAMVHAGLVADWSIAAAQERAREVELALRARPREALAALNARAPDRWSPRLTPAERLRYIVRVLTRLRLCDAHGAIVKGHKGPPETAPAGALPWFDVPGRVSASATVVCGHWAALGLRQRENLVALDSGCVWGGMLSAVRLEDRVVFQQRCLDCA